MTGRMFRTAHVVARAELTHVLRRPLVPIGAALIGLLTYQPIAYVGPGSKGLVSFGALDHDAPVLLATLMARVSVAGMLFTALLFGEAGHRDRADGWRSLLLTTPAPVAGIVAGRYLAALVANLMIVATAMVAAIAGLAGLGADHVGGAGWTALVAPVALQVVPTVAATGALFLALSLVGGMPPVLIGAVVLGAAHAPLVALATGEGVAAPLAAAFDPFGLAPIARAARFWSPGERNVNPIPMDVTLAIGRMLWLGAGAVALGVAGRLMRRTIDPSRSTGPSAVRTSPARDRAPHGLRAPSAIGALVSLELRRAALHPATLVLSVLAAVQVARNVSTATAADGTGSLPFTAFLVGSTANIDEFVIALTVLASSILIWRDHDANASAILEASPLTGMAALASKLAALVAAQIVVLGVAATVTVTLQRVKGGTPDSGTYALALGLIELPRYVGWAVIALAAQVVAPTRWVGLGLSAGVIIFVEAVLPAVGVRSPLLLFGSVPTHRMSAMNGLAPFTESIIAFRLYWLAWLVPLFVVTSQLWRRGIARSLVTRWRERAAAPRGTRLLTAGAVAVAAGFAVGTAKREAASGQTRLTPNEFRAEYERRFRALRDAPAPALAAVHVELDFFPAERRARISGRYVVVNRGASAVERLDVFLFPMAYARLVELRADRLATPDAGDPELGHSQLTLASPIAPGDSVRLDWVVDVQSPRIATDGGNPDLAPSGSYIDNFLPGRYFPSVGYDTGMELQDAGARTAAGLSALAMPASDRVAARVSAVHPVIRYSAEVRTSDDQVVVAPGREVRSWTAGGRHHVRYEADTLFGSLAFVSGRYERAITRRGATVIETFTHPGHERNLPAIVSGAAATLALGPRLGGANAAVVRIVEVPDYGHIGGTARAMSNMIVWNETGGWLGDYRAPGAFPYAFATAAHEAAHQWWPGLVQPARAGGFGVIGEGLPDLARIRAIERHLGPAAIAEWMRLQSRQYFRGRTTASEVSLRHAVNVFEYRQKSQFAFRWLSWAADTSAVDRAVRGFTREFTTSREHPVTDDLLDHLHATLPDSLAPAVSAWFDRKQTWDLRVMSARAGSATTGYAVEAEVFVRRIDAEDASGTKVAGDETIEIGLYDRAGRQLSVARVLVPQGRSIVRLLTSGRPARIVIDPQELLLDAEHADDSRSIESQSPMALPSTSRDSVAIHEG